VNSHPSGVATRAATNAIADKSMASQMERRTGAAAWAEWFIVEHSPRSRLPTYRYLSREAGLATVVSQANGEMAPN
jgi:hypothetical protein